MNETATLTEPATFMRSVLQRIATGPEYSKDISQEEAREALNIILDGKADPVQAGIYFIALRMKRETLEENAGSLEALLEHTQTAEAQVPRVVDIVEPLDGCIRGLPMGAFLPAVLSACGTPALCQGVESVGPKFGATVQQVLQACGADTHRTSEQVAAQISDANCGWGYLDQAQACPALHQLRELRTRIVKRPVLTTVEVLLRPIRGQESTHLITGYVHKPYPPVYAHLARVAGFDSALIVRGVEGGVFPSLKQSGKAFEVYGDAEEVAWDFHPNELGYASEHRTVPLSQPKIAADQIVQEAAQAGQEALAGKAGPAQDSLTYAASVILAHLDRNHDLKGYHRTACEALNSGQVKAIFEAGL